MISQRGSIYDATGGGVTSTSSQHNYMDKSEKAAQYPIVHSLHASAQIDPR